MTPIRPIKDPRAYLEPSEVERLIAAATNPRDGLLALVGRSQSTRTYPLRFISDYKTLSKIIPIDSIIQIPPQEERPHEEGI